jgi:ElaB/YqjD/DUF883 family membrane-anchored ribosome-binding protein
MTSSSSTGIGHAAASLLDGAQHALRPAADALHNGLDQVRANTAPALHGLVSGAEELALSRLRAARDQALRLRDSSTAYARGHPLQTLMVAAAAGAGLMLVLGLLVGKKRPG